MAGEDKELYTFPKGSSPKVKVIVWLEFELAYYVVAEREHLWWHGFRRK